MCAPIRAAAVKPEWFKPMPPPLGVGVGVVPSGPGAALRVSVRDQIELKGLADRRVQSQK